MPQNRFDVLVMASMSAGKTSLINGLIGCEMLHVANEATTAVNTCIEHQRGAKTFTGSCYSQSGLLLNKLRCISSEQLRTWNADSQITRISLSGRFKSRPGQTSGLVLHDTPGPNNSLDRRHADRAFEAVRRVPFKTLLYVLDAAQLGTSDDMNILERLCQETCSESRDAFCFVLNKVDLLDVEKGEALEAYVEKAQFYLAEVGFDNAVIIPTMANAGLYARKAWNDEPLSRFQLIKLQQALDELPIRKQTLLETARIPASVRNRLHDNLKKLTKHSIADRKNHWLTQENELRELIICSGLGTVEAFIKHQRKLSAPV